MDWIDWWNQELKEHQNKIYCCDRYIIDVYSQAVQYGANLNFLCQLFEVFPKPDFSFFINIEPEEAVSRIKSRQELPQHSLESLSELQKLTTSFSTVQNLLEWEFIYLDGTKSVEENIKYVLALIETRIVI